MNPLSALVRFVKTYSTGVVAATISVSFAAYMLVTGGDGNGLKIDTPVVVHHVPVKSPLKERLEIAIAPTRKTTDGKPLVIEDMLITGSIQKTTPKESLRKPLRSARKRPGGRTTPHYVLRFATPDVALVEGSGRLWSVEPGDILPGAGRVIRIENRGHDHWVVKAYDGRTIREIGSRQD